MAKYFYFTRHGQTVWNVENKICGATAHRPDRFRASAGGGTR